LKDSQGHAHPLIWGCLQKMETKLSTCCCCCCHTQGRNGCRWWWGREAWRKCRAQKASEMVHVPQLFQSARDI